MRIKIKPKPQFWDKKTVIKFAWYPIRVNDLIVWWEMYESTYVYRKDWFYRYYWELYERKVFDKYKKPKWNFQFYKTYQFEWKSIYRSLPELMWKDKFDSPRCELEPYYRFEWLWFGFVARQGTDDEWEQWLWVHEYNDGDVEKAKQTWGWVDYETKESTWNNEYGK